MISEGYLCARGKTPPKGKCALLSHILMFFIVPAIAAALVCAAVLCPGVFLAAGASAACVCGAVRGFLRAVRATGAQTLLLPVLVFAAFFTLKGIAAHGSAGREPCAFSAEVLFEPGQAAGPPRGRVHSKEIARRFLGVPGLKGSESMRGRITEETLKRAKIRNTGQKPPAGRAREPTTQ